MGRDVFPGERLRGVSTTTAAFALVLVTLAAIGVYSTVGTSFRPSSNTPTCVGTTTTVTVPLNRTSTTVQTCSVTQVVLGAGGLLRIRQRQQPLRPRSPSQFSCRLVHQWHNHCDLSGRPQGHLQSCTGPRALHNRDSLGAAENESHVNLQ